MGRRRKHESDEEKALFSRAAAGLPAAGRKLRLRHGGEMRA